MTIRLPARWLYSTIVLGLLLLTSPALYAQGAERDSAEISEAQQTLNDEGVRSMIEGDFAGAVALLERSVRMGENNVTYLNLGRAYQKLGNCTQAREALVMAKTAPVVKDPTEQEVTERADEFLSKLDEQCGTEEPPGDVRATTIDSPTSGATSETSVSGSDQAAGGSAASTWGWVMGGTGVALIGTGVALHFVAEGKRNQVTENEDGVVELSQRESMDLYDQANSLDTAGLGMIIGGGVLGALGTYLILTGADSEESSAILSINPGPSGLSVTLEGRF